MVLELSLCLAAPVAAGPFEDGAVAYERGDYATALRLWRPLAEQGDARAQFAVGSTYDFGLGVQQDYAEAIRWYLKAADQGHSIAQISLGMMYERGEGVPKDYAESVTWYRKAADHGAPLAQYHLGRMYFMGRSLPQDDVQAYMWLTLAAAHFPASLIGERVNPVELRDRVAAKMTAAQIAEAQRLAHEWKPNTRAP